MDTVLLSKIKDFVSLHTSSFDASHNLSHAERVFATCLKIIDNTPHLSEYQCLVICITALVHDVVDHKYNTISNDELFSFIASLYDSELASDILTLIPNISFSKQVNGHRQLLSPPLQLCLDIVSDADRIDALGKHGLERCHQYAKHSCPAATDDQLTKMVYDHCREKLLNLLPKGFIVTKKGKDLAQEGHNEVLDFVNQYENSKIPLPLWNSLY
ncbi:hypothetical protein P9112_005608 [Eukaryota sp. TZLM1-RC]